MRLPPYRLGVPCDSSAHVRKRDRSNMTPPSRPEGSRSEADRSHAVGREIGGLRRQRDCGSRLSAALADLFILVRQRHRRALCRRIHSAGHALGHPLGWRFCNSAAVRRNPPYSRLAAHKKACRLPNAARADGFLGVQHNGLLRPAFHDRDQRPVVAVGIAAVRRLVVIRFIS